MKHTDEAKKKIGNTLKNKYNSREIKKIFKENPSISQLHKWLRKNNLKPMICENCGLVKKLGLANIKGHVYTRNINDYKWLCYHCHHLMDKRKDFCNKGHKMEGDNVLIIENGKRRCKICRLKFNKEFSNDYYYRNKDRHKEIQKRWNLKNIEKMKETDKRYYQEHKEELKKKRHERWLKFRK